MPQVAATPTAAQQYAAAMQQNELAKQMIRNQAIEMYTQLAPVALSSSANNAGMVVNINPRNVGLVKGFFVEFSAVINNGNASAAVTPTNLNVANFFSNITFIDLQNNVRINVPGYQLVFLNTLKQKNPFASAFVGGSSVIDCPVKYGSNTTGTVLGAASTDNIWNAPSTIAHAATGVITGMIWIPLAYSDHDYRGAYYANVINGQAVIQLTVTPAPFYLSGGNQMTTMYGPADSATTCTITSTTIQVTQVYMDQLPIDPRSGLPILPQRDISTIYELKNTTFTSAPPNSDFFMQYPNFRDVISSTVLFDNLTSPPSVGNITNYFSLQAANSTNIFKRTAGLNQAIVRNILGFDLPTGITYFSYRNKPLSTTQYGNLQLIFNPNSNWALSYSIYHCWESFASIATINQAGSLSAG
jgi:hypothetical protein